MRVMIWGFYEEGNLGDDLMAVMIADLLNSLNITPVICSSNPRFRKMGYKADPHLDKIQPDAIVLGGGAFIKSGASSGADIEHRIRALGEYVGRTSTPVVGISIGTDGISKVDNASEARRTVLRSPNFCATTLRLRGDMGLGLRKARFIPDIVFAANYYRLKRGEAEPEWSQSRGDFLINLSRRTLLWLPRALWLSRGYSRAIFRAHSGTPRKGGEISVPFLRIVDTDDLMGSMEALRNASAILSSKLHPGIAALSMGRAFFCIPARPKTAEFISEYRREGIIDVVDQPAGIKLITVKHDLNWQRRLWTSYQEFVRSALGV